MTNEEAIELIKVAQAEVEWNCPMDYAVAFDLAIKALEQTNTLDKIKAEIGQIPSRIRETIERYKPIILQEHDAEPRRLKAILDVKTNDIYVLKITKRIAEKYAGITIEDRNDDAESEDKG